MIKFLTREEILVCESRFDFNPDDFEFFDEAIDVLYRNNA